MVVNYRLPISHYKRTIIPGLLKGIITIRGPISKVFPFLQDRKFVLQIPIQERQQTYDW